MHPEEKLCPGQKFLSLSNRCHVAGICMLSNRRHVSGMCMLSNRCHVAEMCIYICWVIVVTLLECVC